MELRELRTALVELEPVPGDLNIHLVIMDSHGDMHEVDLKEVNLDSTHDRIELYGEAS